MPDDEHSPSRDGDLLDPGSGQPPQEVEPDSSPKTTPVSRREIRERERQRGRAHTPTSGAVGPDATSGTPQSGDAPDVPGGSDATGSKDTPTLGDGAGTSGEPTPDPAGPVGPDARAPRGWRALGHAMMPRLASSQVLVGVLCGVLGFALVVQVSQNQKDQLSSLRETDLIRILDEVTQRSGQLSDQVQLLEATRLELQSGSDKQRAAMEVAQRQAQTEGIMSGRLPAQGPGVEIDVDQTSKLKAFQLFNVLEELRNAGAESIQINGVRLVTSSYFKDIDRGIEVDGEKLTEPLKWVAIGDPPTLETALEIPGGAMASLRASEAKTTVRQLPMVEVDAVVSLTEPKFATPVVESK